MSGKSEREEKSLPDLEAREEFLTTRQLSAVLQVSETTIRRLARAGRIPAVRLTPRLTRYHLQSVRDALNGAARHPSRPRREHETPVAEQQLSFADLL